MLGKSYSFGKIFGIDIRFDISWILIFFLITWVFSTGYFPSAIPDGTFTYYLFLGFLTSIMFFSSLVIHELSHSITARRNGLAVNTITLFMFGGASNLEEEPQTPKIEAKMAFAGPFASFVIADLFYLISFYMPTGVAFIGIFNVFRVLSVINMMLAVFNLLPGFPLDGGRIFRALVWHFNKDYIKATKAAVYGGKVIAFMLLSLGLFGAVSGLVAQRIWLMVIGTFLNVLANYSLEQTLAREELSKVNISGIIKKDYPLVGIDAKILKVIPLFFKDKTDTLFASKNDKIVGYIKLEETRDLSKSDVQEKVSKLTHNLEESEALKSDDSALEAIRFMQKKDISCAPAIIDEKHKGMVFKKDILGILNHKVKGV